VQASFAGDTDYTGNSGSRDLTVTPADQSITFGALSNKIYGDPNFSVSAGASSGLDVTFSASGNCEISGITASQAGSGNYNAAQSVVQIFSIAPATTGISLVSSANPSVVGAAVTYMATISAALNDGTVAFKDGSASIGCDSRVVSSGHATRTVTYTSTGSHTITAIYSGDTNYAGSTTTSALAQGVGITVHGVSTNSLTVVLQLWNASNVNISSPSLTVTAKCVMSSTTVPTNCGSIPVQSIIQPFTFQPAGKKTAARYSYTVGSTGLTRKYSYYLLVQANGDPAWYAIPFMY
jgi:hypothetical protein